MPIMELKPLPLLPLTYVVCCHMSAVKKRNHAKEYQTEA